MNNLRKPNGTFLKGHHWRAPKPFWTKEWLEEEYLVKKRSAADISAQFNLHENAILFWLAKHGIKTRTMSEVRKIKKWGVSGADNPMYGKRGIANPNWKGGLTPYRQMVYSSEEWLSFARKIKRRDKVCKLCASSTKLEIHHIEPIRNAPLLIMWALNVILLCQMCHKRIGRRERWWRNRLRKLIIKEEGGDRK